MLEDEVKAREFRQRIENIELDISWINQKKKLRTLQYENCALNIFIAFASECILKFLCDSESKKEKKIRKEERKSTLLTFSTSKLEVCNCLQLLPRK